MTPTRRGFLTGLGATLLASTALVPPALGTAPVIVAKRAAADFIAVVHPSSVDWVRYAFDDPRYRWQREWRRQRLARQGIVEDPPSAEIGVLEGVRFY